MQTLKTIDVLTRAWEVSLQSETDPQEQLVLLGSYRDLVRESVNLFRADGEVWDSVLDETERARKTDSGMLKLVVIPSGVLKLVPLLLSLGHRLHSDCSFCQHENVGAAIVNWDVSKAATKAAAKTLKAYPIPAAIVAGTWEGTDPFAHADPPKSPKGRATSTGESGTGGGSSKPLPPVGSKLVFPYKGTDYLADVVMHDGRSAILFTSDLPEGASPGPYFFRSPAANAIAVAIGVSEGLTEEDAKDSRRIRGTTAFRYADDRDKLA